MAARTGVGVRLYTEGGTVVERELERIGDKGDRELGRLARGASRANPQLRALSAGVDAVNSELSGMAGRLGPVGAGLQQLGPKAVMAGAAIAAVGVALGKVAKEAVAAAGEFEGALLDIGAASNTHGQDLQRVGDQIREIADRWGELPAVTASAALTLVKAGVSIEDTMGGALDAVVAMSRATGDALPASADAAAQAMLVFGLRGDEMAGVADQITAVLNATKYSLEDYTQAVGQGGAVAKIAGLDFKSFNALLAATAASFTSGSDQATSLKTALIRLASPTPQAAAELKRLGISAYDSSGKLKDVVQFAYELRAALASLSTQARSSALAEIFGNDAVRAGSAIADAADKVREFRDEILPTTSAAAQAAQRFEGVRGASAELNQEFKELMITIGEDSGLLGAWTDLQRAMARVLSVHTDIIKSIPNVIEAHAAMFQHLRDNLPLLDRAAEALGVPKWIDGSPGYQTGANNRPRSAIKGSRGRAPLLSTAPDGEAPPAPTGGAGAAASSRDAARNASRRLVEQLEEEARVLAEVARLQSESPGLTREQAEALVALDDVYRQLDEARKAGVITSDAELQRLKDLARATYEQKAAVEAQADARRAAAEAEREAAEAQREAQRAAEEQTRKAKESFREWVDIFQGLTGSGEDFERTVLRIAENVIPKLIERILQAKQAAQSGDSGTGLFDILGQMAGSIFTSTVPTTHSTPPINPNASGRNLNPSNLLPSFGGGRAGGGALWRGQRFTFAETGRPELALLSGSGRVYDHGETVDMMAEMMGQRGARDGSAQTLEIVLRDETNGRVQARERGGAGGVKSLDLMVRDATRGQIESGAFDGAFARRFGLTPRTSSF